MVKRRGSPDRRGMGAQSDYVTETFVPSAQHRAEQVLRARALMAAGVSVEQAAEMMGLSGDELREELAEAKS